jgi:hypothetical protein
MAFETNQSDGESDPPDNPSQHPLEGPSLPALPIGSLKGNCGYTGPEPWKQAERAQYRLTKIQIVINVAIAIVYFLQLRQMTTATNSATQANLMNRDNAHLDQRAWLGIIASDETQTMPETANQPFIIRLGIVNTGKTPAMNVRTVTSFDFSPSGSTPNYAQIDAYLKDYSGVIFPGAKPAIEFPIGATNASGERIPLNEEQFHSIDNGDTRIDVFGKILYDDIFGVHHWTVFSLYVRAPLRRKELQPTKSTMIATEMGSQFQRIFSDEKYLSNPTPKALRFNELLSSKLSFAEGIESSFVFGNHFVGQFQRSWLS